MNHKQTRHPVKAIHEIARVLCRDGSTIIRFTNGSVRVVGKAAR